MIKTVDSLRELLTQLAAVPGARVLENAPLANYTRFAIGGPAAVFFDTNSEPALLTALRMAAAEAMPYLVIGGGTNLIVADGGYEGVILRFTGSSIERTDSRLIAGAGAVLQNVVDQSIGSSLRGMQTMTGIPGYLGGAIYGNAGAYGRSINELLREVRVFTGAEIVTMRNEDCEFRYRTSIFKQQKNWIILSATLELTEGNSEQLSEEANKIRVLRDAKYPPTMRCAGSIFKNLLVSELPDASLAEVPTSVIREGKIPSAWFLEQVGAKGIRRGDIQVASYHANLIYNDGAGTAADLVSVIRDLKARVRDRFGIELEEEVQYVGFGKA